MAFFQTTATTPAAPAEKDIEVAEPPSDSISSLAFSSVADYLAVGSWDNNVLYAIIHMYAAVDTFIHIMP